MYTNRERGDRFDAWVLTQLSEFIPDLRQTIGSGSVFGDQDQVSGDFRVSVKLRGGRGLTLKELREPYNLEAVNHLRAPLTVLRVERQTDEYDWQRLDYAVVDGRLLLLFGKNLLLLHLQELDFEILEDWPAGASLGLLEGCWPKHFLIMMNFPAPAEHCFIFHLYDFMNLLADLTRIRSEACNKNQMNFD